MTKPELFAILAEPQADPEASHGNAEKALLAYVNDLEITTAWEQAKDVQNWWYA